MPAQECEAKRNYIALLGDDGDQRRVLDALTVMDRPMTRTLFDKMAAMLTRGHTTRPSDAVDPVE